MANSVPVAIGAGVFLLICLVLVVGVGGRHWRATAMTQDTHPASEDEEA